MAILRLEDAAALARAGGDVFIFGYGSLIWRPDFAYSEAHVGYVHGYARRFWQTSPDHRGTPQAPGRVVTLVPVPPPADADAALPPPPPVVTEGTVYRVPAADAPGVVDRLCVREAAGYGCLLLDVHCADGATRRALTFVATPDNAHWCGPRHWRQRPAAPACRRRRRRREPSSSSSSAAMVSSASAASTPSLGSSASTASLPAGSDDGGLLLPLASGGGSDAGSVYSGVGGGAVSVCDADADAVVAVAAAARHSPGRPPLAPAAARLRALAAAHTSGVLLLHSGVVAPAGGSVSAAASPARGLSHAAAPPPFTYDEDDDDEDDGAGDDYGGGEEDCSMDDAGRDTSDDGDSDSELEVCGGGGGGVGGRGCSECNTTASAAASAAVGGSTSTRALAAVIATARGASGPNVDYLSRLRDALAERGCVDAHLERLWRAVQLQRRVHSPRGAAL